MTEKTETMQVKDQTGSLLQNCIQSLKTNPGMTLLGTNLGLLLIAFIVFDPFGWIRSSYQDAEPLLDVEPARIDEIQVQVSKEKGQGFILQRGNAISSGPDQTEPEDGPAPSEERKLLESVQGFQWLLKSSTDNSNSQKLRYADARRISNLLYSLRRSRKYYELDNTAAAIKEYNLDQGLQLSVVLDDGSRIQISVGRSSVRGNESYVLVDDTIYLVQENLRRDLGAGQQEFFRNRQIMPMVERRSITQLTVRFKRPAIVGFRNVELAKAGGDWKMLAPSVGPVRETEINLLLDDLLEIRAQEFIDELPARLDQNQAMELSLVYRTSIGNPKTFTVDVLGKKSYDTYLFRTEDGQLFEGSSLYLEKLFQPEQSLLDQGEEPMDFRMP